jgi:hypothetical protein
MAFRIVLTQLAGGQISYALAMKFRAGIVVFKWESACFVDIVASGNPYPCIQEATSQAACAAKNINCRGSSFPRSNH